MTIIPIIEEVDDGPLSITVDSNLLGYVFTYEVGNSDPAYASVRIEHWMYAVSTNPLPVKDQDVELATVPNTVVNNRSQLMSWLSQPPFSVLAYGYRRAQYFNNVDGKHNGKIIVPFYTNPNGSYYRIADASISKDIAVGFQQVRGDKPTWNDSGEFYRQYFLTTRKLEAGDSLAFTNVDEVPSGFDPKKFAENDSGVPTHLNNPEFLIFEEAMYIGTSPTAEIIPIDP